MTIDPIPGVIIPSISEALEWISLGSDPNLGPNLPTIPLHPIPQVYFSKANFNAKLNFNE